MRSRKKHRTGKMIPFIHKVQGQLWKACGRRKALNPMHSSWKHSLRIAVTAIKVLAENLARKTSFELKLTGSCGDGAFSSQYQPHMPQAGLLTPSTCKHTLSCHDEAVSNQFFSIIYEQKNENFTAQFPASAINRPGPFPRANGTVSASMETPKPGDKKSLADSDSAHSIEIYPVVREPSFEGFLQGRKPVEQCRRV